jgi:hypothetical protein
MPKVPEGAKIFPEPEEHYAHYGNTVPSDAEITFIGLTDQEVNDPDNPDEPVGVLTDTEYHDLVLNRLELMSDIQSAQNNRIDALANGVNTIGQMMNEVANAFGQIMEQIQKGGIGGLLGSVMGGKKNDSEEG